MVGEVGFDSALPPKYEARFVRGEFGGSALSFGLDGIDGAAGAVGRGGTDLSGSTVVGVCKESFGV